MDANIWALGKGWVVDRRERRNQKAIALCGFAASWFVLRPVICLERPSERTGCMVLSMLCILGNLVRKYSLSEGWAVSPYAALMRMPHVLNCVADPWMTPREDQSVHIWMLNVTREPRGRQVCVLR